MYTHTQVYIWKIYFCSIIQRAYSLNWGQETIDGYENKTEHNRKYFLAYLELF